MTRQVNEISFNGVSSLNLVKKLYKKEIKGLFRFFDGESQRKNIHERKKNDKLNVFESNIK